MYRFVTIDLQAADVASGLILPNPDWLTRAGIEVDVQRLRSVILSSAANEGEDEFYFALSVGATETQFAVVRTSSGMDQSSYYGQCESDSDRVTHEINQAIRNITAGWDAARLPEEEPDPVSLMAATTDTAQTTQKRSYPKKK